MTMHLEPPTPSYLSIVVTPTASGATVAPYGSLTGAPRESGALAGYLTAAARRYGSLFRTRAALSGADGLAAYEAGYHGAAASRADVKAGASGLLNLSHVGSGTGCPELMLMALGDGGHWITFQGHPIYIDAGGRIAIADGLQHLAGKRMGTPLKTEDIQPGDRAHVAHWDGAHQGNEVAAVGKDQARIAVPNEFDYVAHGGPPESVHAVPIASVTHVIRGDAVHPVDHTAYRDAKHAAAQKALLTKPRSDITQPQQIPTARLKAMGDVELQKDIDATQRRVGAGRNRGKPEDHRRLAELHFERAARPRTMVQRQRILREARGELAELSLLSMDGAGEEELMMLDVGAYGDSGHFITLDGRPVFIKDGAGVVPRRLKADTNAAGRFSRKALERRIIQHHFDASGDSGEYSGAMERELTEAAGDANDAFVFHKHLPTEVKDAIADNPKLRRVFRVSDNATEAHGADAFSKLGDRYLEIAEAKAGSPLRQAKAFAHQSQDPEIKLLAHVHDNLPADPSALKAQATKLRAKGGDGNLKRAARLEKLAAETPEKEVIKAGGLRVGDEFNINGERHRVGEDGAGLRVLRGHEYGEDTPVDAVGHLPIDKGSFKAGKKDLIPFSQTAPSEDAKRVQDRMLAVANGQPATP